MSRPKKGTKSGELASKKWRETMLKKYGGKQGLYKAMSKIGAQGGRNGHTGGFAYNPELARIAGAKGGSISKRNDAISWYENNKDKIDALTKEGCDNKTIANALGVKLSKIYYVKKNYGGTK